ncbi:MAG: hypothetical protein UU16_C0030G0010 [Candidatus Woesebacteria bacterium GW2011_GWA2_40_7]|uniref:Uncharacterized protein n=1 Tax=Candidatus Woesebacteria bacterium GW2011_GWA2_40_7 TaxID=1618562 RepID=A0A0G0WD39_9BACT|nr:MAG: hypothetical protein UU16_C0030G0010 [Candidatus Woesebacteria bacterium GW2011_GWA2_40_7]
MSQKSWIFQDSGTIIIAQLLVVPLWFLGKNSVCVITGILITKLVYKNVTFI